VRELERYAADHGRVPEPALANAPIRDEAVAAVGSGPGGLSAAYHLARLGYRVTIFDAADELGGLLRTGIPEYRLPRDVLDREIKHILAYGITPRTGESIDRARLLDLTRQFDAVFVATGLQSLTSIDLGSSAIVWQGIDFLNRARKGEEDLSGAEVIVVGGGNTAIDAARTALRVGAARVKVIYRRTRNEMPAIAEEIDEALDERIELHELVLPLRLDAADDGAQLTCQRMRLSDPDESGRGRPVPDVAEDAQFVLRCDRVILALGQSAELSILPEGSSVNERGSLLGLTGAPVFAGGDFATNDGTVAGAIGSGRRAALHIHRTLSGEDLLPRPRDQDRIAGPAHVHTTFFTHAARHDGPELPAYARRRTFLEVRQGLEYSADPDVAVAEAQRCFSCGVCNSCDRCVEHCPEGILRRDVTGYRFDYDYCKGCGVCVSECPRGVIYMAEL
jgi:NADPH-dependent glutamate synthase beta subunit-like oxidoreductase/ferredoxin